MQITTAEQARRAGRHNEKVTDEFLSPKGKNIWIKVQQTSNATFQPILVAVTLSVAECNPGSQLGLMCSLAQQPALSWHCTLPATLILPPVQCLLLPALWMPCMLHLCNSLLPYFKRCQHYLLAPPPCSVHSTCAGTSLPPSLLLCWSLFPLLFSFSFY